ncbi:hypothetical protein ACFL27_09330 [candidate division CSSED10-310 bacterium]|uniref:Uncharacterized protein n=1 Tax=candidate division CSSED10-310 bacterium TaxID=2855610 RepID=A0ABV6YWD8_UNCC1
MNIFFYISLFFLLAVAGVSIDLYRFIARTKRPDTIGSDDMQVEHEVTNQFDAEDERETSTGWKAPDFLKRETTPRELPRPLEDISVCDSEFLPPVSNPLIICPPRLDAMVAAAILLRRYEWADVQVISKYFFIKSIWKLIKKTPRPDHFIIIGMEAGYVYGRRFIQTFKRVHEQGIKLAWYDNHTWLPVIAKNISDYCFDFLLVDQAIPISQLIQKRFLTTEDPALADILSTLNPSTETSRDDNWSLKWNELLHYSVDEGSPDMRARLVKKLTRLSPLKPFDHYHIRQYRRRKKLTREILAQQRYSVQLLKGKTMSILDIRPFHRERAPDGKDYFVFRGEKPTYELMNIAFDTYDCDCILLIPSLSELELIRRPDSDLKLSRLIDLTSVRGTPLKIDGRDDKVTIQLDIPRRRRFYNTLLFRWPLEIPALIKKIADRL